MIKPGSGQMFFLIHRTVGPAVSIRLHDCLVFNMTSVRKLTIRNSISRNRQVANYDKRRATLLTTVFSKNVQSLVLAIFGESRFGPSTSHGQRSRRQGAILGLLGAHGQWRPLNSIRNYVGGR